MWCTVSSALYTTTQLVFCDRSTNKLANWGMLTFGSFVQWIRSGNREQGDFVRHKYKNVSARINIGEWNIRGERCQFFYIHLLKSIEIFSLGLFVAQHAAHFCGICSKALWECRKLQQLCMERLEKQKAKSIRAQCTIPWCTLLSSAPPTHGEILFRLPAITINGAVAHDN